MIGLPNVVHFQTGKQNKMTANNPSTSHAQHNTKQTNKQQIVSHHAIATPCVLFYCFNGITARIGIAVIAVGFWHANDGHFFSFLNQGSHSPKFTK
jgi:hypothetical protein